MTDTLTRTSRFLSLILRHEPGRIGLQLDPRGWADIDELLLRMQPHHPISRELLQRVVESNSKRRFAISDDGLRIRASQGHSIAVDLALAPCEPPTRLFHGTATRFLESIRRQGLLRGDRHHVHLSADIETATAVGRRHGRVVVLHVDAGRMHAEGYRFYRSDNGVWLTDEVPVGFLGDATDHG
ncbi:RNA 2'-phosphotransferase [Marilutibacter chinensis]|uniref:Probable RNA 2'-phosphotransferase n=1 Tax=Marilutibacter chinensis TaxID=2912247 RepID=A0ABS9HTK1_9GAMM|nr:RNA 2'-phosphotransferase [Lysobacter chinensis]MCF7222220.1 RNA 2'-phosphotransferase [Lysobacter chinensis]